MESVCECPICCARVNAAVLNDHMASHAKEDIVAALLRQRGGATSSIGQHVGGRSHSGNLSSAEASVNSFNSFVQTQPLSLVKKNETRTVLTPSSSSGPTLNTAFDVSMMSSSGSASAVPVTSSNTATGPFLMPQMMGMMQVISPCFIPQPNGPPILVNLPSYIYPNLGVMGSVLANQQTPVTAAAGVLSNTAAPSTSFVALAAPSASTAASVTAALLPMTASAAAAAAAPVRPLLILSPTSATASSSSTSPLLRGCQLIPHTGSRDSTKGLKSRTPVGHFSNAKFDSPSSSKHKDSSVGVARGRSASSMFGCTRYAADAPYPAASINIASMLASVEGESSNQLKREVLEDESINSDVINEASQPPEVKQENENSNSFDDKSNSSNSDGNVCTVHTLADLQNALKSDEDIQIVVPNELLETVEFKTFLANLGPFPVTSGTSVSTAAAVAAAAAGASGLDAINIAASACHAPPNTPVVTRPPSATPGSPQPGSSRDLSRTGFPEMSSSSMLSPPPPQSDMSDAEDITLQDLVAMETMDDDIGDDDQYFNHQHHNPYRSMLINRLSDDDEDEFVPNDVIFTCQKCDLRFASFAEFNRHQLACCRRRGHGKKGLGKKSGKKTASKVETVTYTAEEPSLEESNANLDPAGWPPAGSADSPLATASGLCMMTIKSENSTVMSSSDLIRPNSSFVKTESFDSSSQPALGAPGQNHWKCNQCRVVFESAPELWEHLDTLMRSNAKCTICHIIFDDRKQALAHRKKLHPSLSKVKAEPLDSTSMANENGEFICDKCDRAFKDRDLLAKHQSCHDEARPYECLECGKKFTKGSLLRNHRRRHFEVGAFECQLCQKRFYTPNKLREHERIHTGEAPLACNICGKTFRRHSNLSEHKRIHQEVRPAKPPKELFCHCGKVFTTQRDLDWHKEGEHEKIPKKCTHCGEIFIHSSSLTRHIRQKHETDFLPTDKKSSLYAKCPVCQQTFYKTSIHKHIRIKHQGQKSFQCDVCKMSFVSKYNLINHQWQHKGVRARPFKCQQCNKSYLRKSLLDAHMRSHRGVKPFVCNECGLQFANKSNWQRHVAEHSGCRNYACPRCDKRFSRNYYLTDHLKTHTGEKPFVCTICGKSAATRSNYNSHLRTHITREPVNSEV